MTETVQEAPMERTHRVFTTTPGAELVIGNFGKATNDSPARVPADVAEELSAHEGLRVEAIAETAPPSDATAEPTPTKRARKGQEE